VTSDAGKERRRKKRRLLNADAKTNVLENYADVLHSVDLSNSIKNTPSFSRI
jgi:hypothetical protein